MSEQKKILVIPSWYPTKEKPTSGTYFREQSELISDIYEVKILRLHKNWISKRRYALNKFNKNQELDKQPIDIFPPTGFSVGHSYIAAFSPEKNFEILKEELQYLAKHIEDIIGWKPDIIHAHCAFWGGIYAQIIAEELSIPFLITEHFNPFILNRWTKFEQELIVNALESANQVLGVSTHQCQNILMQEIDCKPIAIGNLVDDHLFQLKEIKDQQRPLQLLFVTLYPNFIKDVDTFFEALTLLKKNGFNFEATIVGGQLTGEYQEDYYQQRILEFGLENNCRNIKSVDRADMPELMQQSDILVSTSIAESFGVGICEALLCGTPVIITPNGGEQDYFNSNCGQHIPFRSPQELASAIQDFQVTKFNASLMRQSIVEKFGREAFRNKLISIYDNL